MQAHNRFAQRPLATQTLINADNTSFYSQNPVLPVPGNQTFKFGGAQITVEIHAGYFGVVGPADSRPTS